VGVIATNLYAVFMQSVLGFACRVTKPICAMDGFFLAGLLALIVATAWLVRACERLRPKPGRRS